MQKDVWTTKKLKNAKSAQWHSVKFNDWLYGFPIPKSTEKQAFDDSRIDFTTTNVPSGFIFLRMDECLQAQVNRCPLYTSYHSFQKELAHENQQYSQVPEFPLPSNQPFEDSRL